MIEGREDDMTAHQRAGLITFWLMQGSRLTTTQIARLLGITPRGALYLMDNLSGSLPVEHVGGKWRIARDEGCLRSGVLR